MPEQVQQPLPEEIVQKPSVGRIVLYTPPDESGPASVKSQSYPAVITHVWSDWTVNLHVIQDGSFPLNTTVIPTSVSYSRDQAPNSWTWPPRV